MAEQSPTVHRRLLGTQLRKLREKAGIKPDEVAQRLECHKAKVGRMENGKVGITPRDARDMIDLYGVTGTQRDRPLEIARQSRQRSMWHNYWNAVPEPFYNYLGLESSASSIKVFENTYINGLLQIEPYTRALIEGINPKTAESDRKRIVALRQKRAEVLTRENDPPGLVAIIDEAVISRVVGNAAVMTAQLQHLIHLSDLPNVSIRIVPRSAGAYPGMEVSFFILEFPENEDLDVVLTEGVAGAFFLENPEIVHPCKQRFDAIIQRSLSLEASRALLKSTVGEFNLS